MVRRAAHCTIAERARRNYSTVAYYTPHSLNVDAFRVCRGAAATISDAVTFRACCRSALLFAARSRKRIPCSRGGAVLVLRRFNGANECAVVVGA